MQSASRSIKRLVQDLIGDHTFRRLVQPQILSGALNQQDLVLFRLETDSALRNQISYHHVAILRFEFSPGFRYQVLGLRGKPDQELIFFAPADLGEDVWCRLQLQTRAASESS